MAPSILHVPSNEAFVKRIQALYKHYGSARKMGPALGVHWVTIYRWLKGDVDVMRLPLRTYFNVMGGTVGTGTDEGGTSTTEGAGEALATEGGCSEVQDSLPALEDVPVYLESRLAEYLNEHGLPTGMVPPETMVGRPSEYLEDRNLYGVLVSSPALQPQIMEGTVALVAPSRNALPDRFVAARLRSGDVLIRLYTLEEGKVILRAANEDYPALTLNPNKVDWIYPVVWLKLP